jgi:hypothetical protein
LKTPLWYLLLVCGCGCIFFLYFSNLKKISNTLKMKNRDKYFSRVCNHVVSSSKRLHLSGGIPQIIKASAWYEREPFPQIAAKYGCIGVGGQGTRQMAGGESGRLRRRIHLQPSVK